MSIFNFLKKKKIKKEKEKEPLEIKEETKEEKEKSEKKEEKTTKKGKRKGLNYEIIKKPHISEKATYLAEKNQYVFEVSSKANKSEIKKAIEDIYGVNVLSVKIIKIPPKKRRVRWIEGFRKGYKKAIVRIKDNQKIELI